jgi:hypothetical protein
MYTQGAKRHVHVLEEIQSCTIDHQKQVFLITIFHENLSVVDGPSKLCICLEDDLFMATPAWPTPMRALISKMNLSHAPERLTDSALFNRWARRAVACIPTSSIDVAARSSGGGVQCGSATARHRANAPGQ